MFKFASLTLACTNAPHTGNKSIYKMYDKWRVGWTTQRLQKELGETSGFRSSLALELF